MAWARARRAKSGHSYTDPKRVAHALAISSAWMEAGRPRLEGALRVHLDFYLPRPKSHLRANGMLTPSAPRYPTGRPDVDNLGKIVCDSLNTLVYDDDAAIVDLRVVKHYGDPRTVIRIEEVEGGR